MKKLILTLIFGFVGFFSVAAKQNEPINRNAVFQNNFTKQHGAIDGKISTLKNFKVKENQVMPLDFSVMLLSCGKTVSWQNTNTSAEAVVFWWYIYDWMYC